MSPDDSPTSPTSHVVELNGRRPSDALVSAVATLSGVEPPSLSPLYGVVEAEALDALYEHARVRPEIETSEYAITFPYEGYDVTLEFEGRLRLEEREE